jgi:hypothetical protein
MSDIDPKIKESDMFFSEYYDDIQKIFEEEILPKFIESNKDKKGWDKDKYVLVETFKDNLVFVKLEGHLDGNVYKAKCLKDNSDPSKKYYKDDEGVIYLEEVMNGDELLYFESSSYVKMKKTVNALYEYMTKNQPKNNKPETDAVKSLSEDLDDGDDELRIKNFVESGDLDSKSNARLMKILNAVYMLYELDPQGLIKGLKELKMQLQTKNKILTEFPDNSDKINSALCFYEEMRSNYKTRKKDYLKGEKRVKHGRAKEIACEKYDIDSDLFQSILGSKSSFRKL